MHPARLVDTLLDPNWRLLHSPPPYVEELLLPVAPRFPRRYSLLILDVPGINVDRAALQFAIRGLRRSFAMPVFVAFNPAGDTTARGLRAAVISAGGEVLPRSQALRDRALYVLTQRRDLASDWISWIRLHRQLGPREEGVIRALLSPSDDFRSSTDALSAAGFADRSARRWLAASNLPAASRWFHAGRILRALLRLQRDPDLMVHEVPIQLGYSGADTFSNQMFRYFGHGAKKGRSLLGLEPRFQAFEARAATRRP
jgi:hypothetical protein